MTTLLNLVTPIARRHRFGVLSLFLAWLHLALTPVWAQSVITTFAGAVEPSNGALAIQVAFAEPGAVIFDASGGFYFAVTSPQNRVYRVAANGTVTVFAGNGIAGSSGDGGPATSAQLNNPSGLALDGSGSLLIAESSGHRIRKVTPDGVIITVAGNGTNSYGGDGGPAALAQLNFPAGIVVDGNGNLLIADTNNHRIRKVTGGVISTVAGLGTPGFSGDGGPALTAQMRNPRAIALDGSSNLLIADSGNSRIRRVTLTGVISTVAGGSTSGFPAPIGDNGPATSARLSSPQGVAVDGGGNLLIADSGNSRIRKVTTGGIISTVAGTGSYAFTGDNGPATLASLNFPRGVAVDGTGTLLIADSSNHRIRQVTPQGVISTVAGNGTVGFRGDGGPATSALLNSPSGLAVDPNGNLLIADTSNLRIRRVTPAGIISTFAGNGNISIPGNGGPATSASLNYPSAIATAPDGSVYIADCSDRVRKVRPDGIIDQYAAANWLFCDFYYYDYYEDFSRAGIALDAAGNLFVADTFHYRVYKVTPTGAISVVAGTGSYGFSGDGGPATSAQIAYPWGVAVDGTGNLYIADSYNHRVRKVTPQGIISTMAGSGDEGYGGDGGPATSAQLSGPRGIAVDAAGNLYIADTSNYRVRKVTPEGIITTVAGNGTAGSGGDGGPPSSAQLNYPAGVAVNAAGYLFISDLNNHRIRKVVFALTVPTLTSVSPTFAGQGTTTTIALQGTSFASPLTIDAGSGITVTDVRVMSETQTTAKLAIASNAALGTRNINVTTNQGTSGNLSFNVVEPYPDVSITSSHTGNLGVGFNETYMIGIANVGSAATTSAMTLTDILPNGLTYVSGTGNGWSCSSSVQTVTCVNPESLAAGASTTLNLTVAVAANVASLVNHAPRVDVEGDPFPSNNTTTELKTVAFPTVNLRFNPQNPSAGSQATLDVTINTSYAHDVTGTLTLAFSSNAILPADDPAIQFATGGREVTFTIPANTLQARFGINPPGPIGFQMGTVAGSLSFNGMLQTGDLQTLFSAVRGIARLAPTVHSVLREGTDQTSFSMAIKLSSTPREVRQLILVFSTVPFAQVSCGTVTGCSASGNTLTFDVKSIFDNWFATQVDFGSSSSLRVPLSIDGKFEGSVSISLRNSVGTSNTFVFPLP